MRPLRLLTAAAIIAAVVLSAAPAAAGPVRANHVTAFKFRVGCGAQLKAAGGGISCFSEALPSTELDGYVELHATGEAVLGERGDSPWRPGKLRKLKKGQTWSKAGVECRLRGVLRCVNGDEHGFTLSPRAYTTF